MNEKAILNWLIDQSVKDGESIYIGDDAAYISELCGLYLTTDTMVENVHFLKDLFSHHDLAYRAIGTSISDLAAMGTVPKYILIALGVPKNFNVQSFLKEALEVAKCFNVVLIGGDMTNSSSIFINVTGIGIDLVKLPGPKTESQRKPCLRSNLKPDQDIFITGNCGISQAGLKVAKKISLNLKDIKVNPATNKSSGVGRKVDRDCVSNQNSDLRFLKSSKIVKDSIGTLSSFDKECLFKYLKPEPKIREAIIARQAGATAMTDTSDSLACSLNDFALNSRCGIDIDSLPKISGLSESTVLNGGEDYEILFSIDSDKADRMLEMFSKSKLLLPIKIGHSNPMISGVRYGRLAITPKGYEHKFK